jgi:MYXO-CTERM domain-containing protein
MRSRRTRFALFVLDLSAAASTVLGGVTLVLGIGTFPKEWLAGTPFADYLVPGLILTVVVGGSATAAAIATARSARLGAVLSAVAGAVLAGWIVGELLLLNQNGAETSPRSPVEAIFFVLGLAMLALGLVLWRRSRRRSRPMAT